MEKPLPAGWNSLNEKEREWALFSEWLVETAENYQTFHREISPATSYEEDQDQDFAYKFFLNLGITRLIGKKLVIESNRPVRGEIVSASIGEGKAILFIERPSKYEKVQPQNIADLVPGKFQALDYIF